MRIIENNFQIKNKSWIVKKQRSTTESNNCDNHKEYLFNVLGMKWQSKTHNYFILSKIQKK